MIKIMEVAQQKMVQMWHGKPWKMRYSKPLTSTYKPCHIEKKRGGLSNQRNVLLFHANHWTLISMTD